MVDEGTEPHVRELASVPAAPLRRRAGQASQATIALMKAPPVTLVGRGGLSVRKLLRSSAILDGVVDRFDELILGRTRWRRLLPIRSRRRTGVHPRDVSL